MSAFKEVIASAETIRDSIYDYAVEALRENKEYILDMLRQGQLAKGESPLETGLPWTDSRDGGSSGTGFYAKETEKYAEGSNTVMPKVEGDLYNFQWSGATFNNMDFEIKSTDIDFLSRTFYFRELTELYGEVFHLSQFHEERLNEDVILPYITNKILEEMAKIV